MVGAGLLAKKAVERGLTHQALGQDQPGAGLAGGDRLPRGLRAAAVPRRSSASTPWATAAPPASATAGRCPSAIAERDRRALPGGRRGAVAATGTSRRGSTRRCGPTTSPRRCWWWRSRWRAGSTSTSSTEPLGTGQGRAAGVPHGHLAHARRRSRTRWPRALKPELFTERYGTVFDGDETWQALAGARAGAATPGTRASTYVQEPPFFQDLPAEPAPLADISGARVLAVLGDSVTTDHISPAGSIPKNGPAARYLLEHGVEQADWNTFGSRRGNHEVMMRGTFGNVRIKNALVPGQGGQLDPALPHRRGDVDLRRRDAVHQEAGTPLVILAGKEYGTGSSRDWAAKGTGAPRREGGHRRELRADPPEQPGGHGRAAAGLRAGHHPGVAGPHRDGDVQHHRHREGTHPGRPGRRSTARDEAARRPSSRRWCASTRRWSWSTTEHGGILQRVLRQFLRRRPERH